MKGKQGSGDYQPVDCGFHSELELAIMHDRRLTIRWQQADGAAQQQSLKPIDLITRQHQEFLVYEDEAGQRDEIRLDNLLQVVSL